MLMLVELLSSAFFPPLRRLRHTYGVKNKSLDGGDVRHGRVELVFNSCQQPQNLMQTSSFLGLGCRNDRNITAHHPGMPGFAHLLLHASGQHLIQVSRRRIFREQSAIQGRAAFASLVLDSALLPALSCLPQARHPSLSILLPVTSANDAVLGIIAILEDVPALLLAAVSGRDLEAEELAADADPSIIRYLHASAQ